jgi:hypothetical protein
MLPNFLFVAFKTDQLPTSFQESGSSSSGYRIPGQIVVTHCGVVAIDLSRCPEVRFTSFDNDTNTMVFVLSLERGSLTSF